MSSRKGLRKRSVVEKLNKLPLYQREEMRASLPIYEEYASDRPKTRGECIDTPRPCPWISCRHHNGFEIQKTGNLLVAFPEVEVEDLQDTCSLDVADRGGHTLDDVAVILNMTRERARQIQDIAFRKIAITPCQLREYVDRPDPSQTSSHHISRSSVRKQREVLLEAPKEEEAEEEVQSDDDRAVSFFSDHHNADKRVTDRIWRVYLSKTS